MFEKVNKCTRNVLVANMAQIWVVNCFSCEIFQGQLAKKGKKWTCKMCGEKQSFRKIFAKGTGKECRQIIQKLNMISGNAKRRMLEEACVRDHSNKATELQHHEDGKGYSRAETSKWDQFVPSEVTESKELDDDDGSSFTTERETFNKHKTQKRKQSLTEIPDNPIENCQRKMPKYGHKMYPHQTNETNLGDSNHEGRQAGQAGTLPQKNEENCGSALPKRPNNTSSSTKFSKWSKYS